MEYLEYNTIEDFIFNQSFRNWVLHRESQESDFWEKWISEHPEKIKLINDSKAIIYALQINFRALSDHDIDTEIKKVLEKLKDRSAEPENLEHASSTKIKRRFIASSRPYLLFSSLGIVLFIVLPLCFFFYRDKNIAPANKSSVENAEIIAHFTQHVNNNIDTARLVILPDGSKAYLEAKSKLSYAQNFSDSNREVYLTGEAFFEIKKNPSKPFLVYTSSIITKVLGTSFRVRAYSSDKKAVVTVKTGKVSVFKAENFKQSFAIGSELGGIVVTPNQEVVYHRDNKEMSKKLAEKPLLIIEPVKTSFTFNATPVSHVFKIMQDAYGIPIVYDEEVISTCSLSASLGKDSFYEKLNLICKAINASYEMIDGNIVITSNGCK